MRKLERMGKGLRMLGVALGLVCVGLVASHWLQIRHYQSAFASTRVGDTEAVVIERFGSPRYREPKNQPYTRYADRPCEDACERRLWWEVLFLPGIEAWSVEIGANHTVLGKAHWLSP